MRGEQRVRVTVSGLRDRLTEVAAVTGESMSFAARQAIRNYVANHTGEQGKAATGSRNVQAAGGAQ